MICHACNWRGSREQLHRETDALGVNLYCPSKYCGAQIDWEPDPVDYAERANRGKPRPQKRVKPKAR